MKKISVLIFLILIIIGISFSQTIKNTLKDGLYLINKQGTDTTIFDELKKSEMVINFNYLFIEKNDQEFSRILVDTTEYVPLELEKSPTTEQQTEIKKKLLFSLTKEASLKLKTFTANHIMSKVALIVDGEVVSIHKIREPITSGQLQITTCSKNACERLVVKMKNNIKKQL